MAKERKKERKKFSRVGQGLRLCIPNNLPTNDDAAGVWTTF